MKEEAVAFIKMLWDEQRGAFIGTVVGVLFALFILLFGLWRVLFVLLCSGAGLWLGRKFDKVGAAWADERSHWSRNDSFK